MARELLGQTVVVIGGSAGIGLETARRARAEGAEVILTGRNPERLAEAASQFGARQSAAFDANDAASLASFFGSVPTPIDHVMVTAGGPAYGPLLEMNSDEVRQAVSGHIVLGLDVARNAVGKMRPGGSLVLMGGTGGRRIGHGLGIVSAATAALPRSQPRSRSNSPLFVSTSLQPASSTPRCRHRCSEIGSRNGEMSSGRRCRSAVSSVRKTSPRSPCIS
jgi:NADP-dependent 3-hydroxy acid dehydrogenase YdfG